MLGDGRIALFTLLTQYKISGRQVACMQLMPDEVILAIALADLPMDIDDKQCTKIRKKYGGSWWFLACECDDHYLDIVKE